MSEGQVRVAVVGTGAIAQIVHLPLLREMPGAVVEAVCDVDDSKAGAIAGRLGIPHVYDRLESLLDADVADAVVLCTPNHLHAEQAIMALEAGKHVLVERPLALRPDDVEAAVAAAEKADRVLMVAYNNRYRPDTQGLRSFIEAGELGRVFTMHGTWFSRKIRPKRRTWRHTRDTGGGAFLDLGVQVLDLCLWMAGYPEAESVCAHLHPGENMEVEDAAAVLIRLKDAATLSIQVTWSLLADRDRHHVRVFGTAGSASTQPLKVFKEIEQGMLDVTPQIAQRRENAYTASYREELRRFVAASLGHQPAVLPREQVDLMRIVSRVYESAEKGREIRL
jgi:predicted dehydrogenase